MTQFDASLAPGTLEMREGVAYIVRKKMIDYCNEVLDDMEISLARIPTTIEKYFGTQAGPYLEEAVQRAVLEEGFAAIEEKCYNISLEFYNNSPILPAARVKAARANVDAIPSRDAFKTDLGNIAGEVKVFLRELPFQFDLNALVFEDGKLKVYQAARDGIAPMYTAKVEQTELDTAKKIQELAERVADLKKTGIQVDGILKRFGAGVSYSDDELISWLKGTPLPR